jgi:uncharacterized protein YndB with AHSA1/START domain
MKNTGTLKVTRPSDTEIVLTRVFDAPRRLVIEAFTRPELLKRWYGPRGYSLVVCEIDFRTGGTWRFVLRNPEGKDMGMRGVYGELALPDWFNNTESFDDFPGEAQVSNRFVEEGGKTTVNVTVTYASKEVGDIVINSGMEHGAAETYDRLAELLPELAKA